jgi:threonine dehydrogenase-like Zn-dependent dehydrogenase
VGVLLEPLSVSEKGINQTFEIQRRLKVWEPQRAAVLGAGPIGLLAALALRLRGMEVVCYSRKKPPNLKADLIEEIGGRYISSKTQTLAQVAAQYGEFDLIIEASGHSPLIFEAAADALAANGVLVLESVTGGETTAQIPADRINQGFVLGNKVMFGTVNASHADFVSGVNDLLAAEATYPGWLAKLLTTPVRGLENYADMVRNLNENADAIKIFIDVLPTQQQHQH